MPSSQTQNAIIIAEKQEKANLLGIIIVSAYFRLCRSRHKRKTFCSILAQNGVSTAVTQRLLEHSSPNLTNKIYTNVDPVLRQSVESLPIEQWLKK